MATKNRKNFKKNDHRKFSRKHEYYEKEKDAQNTKESDYSKSCNDPSWWAADPALLRDSASLPFSFATGVTYDMGSGRPFSTGDTVKLGKAKLTVPGVAAFNVFPCLGYADSVSAPVNIAASSMYTFVRHANSGARNYDAMDLMIYTLAMANAISAINWAQRIYGFALMYTQRNRYMPRVLCQANHVNYDSIAHNLAAFRMGINVLINKVASLVVPATQPIFRRMAFLYSNLYSEGESIKDQMYMYVPRGFYQYTHDDDGKGQLTISLISGPLDYEGILDYINSLIEPIFLDEDSNTMSGDIMKAYGLENCIKFVQLPEQYVVAPIYNKEVLEQMHNATPIHLGSPEYLSLNATQQIEDIGGDTRGWLKCIPRISNTLDTESRLNAIRLTMDKILTTHNLAPEPGDIMVDSRMMVAGVFDERNNYTELYTGCDFVDRIQMYTMNPSDPEGDATVETMPTLLWADSSSTIGRDTIHALITASQFDYMPILPFMTSFTEHDGLTDYNFERWLGDIDNFAVVANTNVKAMHDAALLSAYNVPVANIIK